MLGLSLQSFLYLRGGSPNELLHTLTLGQALMPVGLPVEGRIMRHARGPRRAWLKHSYLPLYLRSPLRVLWGRCSQTSRSVP